MRKERGDLKVVGEADREYITFEIEPDLKERLKAKVESEERTMSQALRFLVKQYLGESIENSGN